MGTNSSFALGVVFGLLLGLKISKTFLKYAEVKYRSKK
jgi:hypothetical protein